MAGHQKKSAQSFLYMDGTIWQRQINLSSWHISIERDETERQRAAAVENTTAQKIWDAFPPRRDGWTIISLVGRRISLKTAG